MGWGMDGLSFCSEEYRICLRLVGRLFLWSSKCNQLSLSKALSTLTPLLVSDEERKPDVYGHEVLAKLTRDCMSIEYATQRKDRCKD